MLEFALAAKVRPSASFLALLLFAFSFSACSDAKFEADSKSNDSAKKKPKTNNERRFEKLDEISDDSDDESVSEPTEIAGAFLRCVVSEDSRSSSIRYACGLQDGNKKLIIESKKLSFEVYDASNRVLPTNSFSQGSLAGTPWHAVFLTKKRASGILAALEIGGREYKFMWSEFSDFKLTTELGSDFDFHIGDESYSGSSCRGALQKKETQGSELKIKIELLKETAVDVSMSEICGVDYQESNKFMIKDSLGNTVHSENLHVGDSTFDRSFVLAAGSYEFHVAALESLDHIDRDNFIVGGIKVSADQAITIISPE